jgi:hypothetical protein
VELSHGTTLASAVMHLEYPRIAFSELMAEFHEKIPALARTSVIETNDHGQIPPESKTGAAVDLPSFERGVSDRIEHAAGERVSFRTLRSKPGMGWIPTMMDVIFPHSIPIHLMVITEYRLKSNRWLATE